ASGIGYLASRGASDLVSRLSVIALLWIGSGLVIDRSLSAGVLMSMYAPAGYLAGPMVALVTSNRTLQEALIAADRLFEILDLETDRTPGTLRIPSDTPPAVILEGVTFRYGARRPVLERLDLRIGAGELTAI